MLFAMQKDRAGGTRRGKGLVSLYYQLYELNHAAMGPFRAAADAARLYFKNPLNPFAHTTYGKSLAATAEFANRHDFGSPALVLRRSIVTVR